MKLIAGLGNPGVQYEGTRHNVGFVVLDRLARRNAPGEPARSKFHGAVIDAIIGDEKVVLLRPATFVNRSGQSLREAADFYNLDPASQLLVIVDDLALPCGSIRLRGEGSAGGHNGLADIEQKLGTTQYARLRIGIDSPGPIAGKEYVLSRFRPDQLSVVEEAMDEAVNAAVCWCRHGISEAMNRFNRRDSA